MQPLPQDANPLTVAAYVAGLLLSVPVVIAMVKAVFFFATVTTKLNNVADSLANLAREMRDFRHDKNDQMQGYELSLVIIETDVNALQEKAGLPVRNYPDRRSGNDRRQA